MRLAQIHALLEALQDAAREGSIDFRPRGTGSSNLTADWRGMTVLLGQTPAGVGLSVIGDGISLGIASTTLPSATADALTALYVEVSPDTRTIDKVLSNLQS